MCVTFANESLPPSSFLWTPPSQPFYSLICYSPTCRDWKRKYYNIELQISEITISQERVGFISQELERLQRENKELEGELAQWRYKYAEYSHLDYQNKDLMLLQVLHCAEIESLRNQLSQKIRESVTIKTVEVPLRQSKTYTTTSYSIENVGSLKQSQGMRSSNTNL